MRARSFALRGARAFCGLLEMRSFSAWTNRSVRAFARWQEDNMKYNVKKNAGLISLAFAAAMSFATLGNAATPHNYRFEIIGQPSGKTLTVRLVDKATGQPVSDARIFAIHRQWLPAKGEPRFLDRRIALTPNGNGAFTYESSDVQTGVTIRMVARIDDEASDIFGSVRVGD